MNLRNGLLVYTYLSRNIDYMVFNAALNSSTVLSRRQLTLFMWTLPRKYPEDPVRLELRAPGLRVKHFTTEPSGTLSRDIHVSQNTIYKYANR